MLKYIKENDKIVSKWHKFGYELFESIYEGIQLRFTNNEQNISLKRSREVYCPDDENTVTLYEIII